MSGFVTRAIRHELEREQLGELLADLEGVLGPPDEVMMAEPGALFDELGRAGKRRRPRARRR